MARKSPQRPNAKGPEASPEPAGTADAPNSAEQQAKEPEASPEPAGITADPEGAEQQAGDPAEGSADDPTAAPADRSLWTATNVEPVEIALPAGVGYTLRAYRLSTALAPTDIAGREDDDDPFAGRTAEADDDEVVILDEEFAALTAEDETDDQAAEEEGESTEAKSGDEAEPSGDDTEASRAEEPESEEETAEEVPFFLTHRGKLLLFKSPESLVAFVRSGAPHDLADLDNWAELAERIQPADVAAADDDSYELDLVVENLRGGNDTWDLPLLIRAGEIARDLAYALRLSKVLAMMSPGSPLDNLDEALRAAASGGIAGFMGRRRLRKIGAQQASLGWRTIIGKISAAVDWRD